jgi:hypothetical protein
MGGKDRSVGMVLEFGRDCVDQEPCAKNLSFVRSPRQGWSVRSEVGGRWKGFSPV